MIGILSASMSGHMVISFFKEYGLSVTESGKLIAIHESIKVEIVLANDAPLLSAAKLAAMMYYLFPFIVFGLFAQATAVSDNIKQQLIPLNATISTRSCSFYEEFDKLVPCGNDGYALSFGNHYCQVYLKNRDDFSDKAWQDATRYCLQKKLYEYAIQQQGAPSCQKLKEFAFDSHTTCYERPDETKPQMTVCDIPFTDKVKVGWMAAGGPLMEVLRTAGSLNFCLF